MKNNFLITTLFLALQNWKFIFINVAVVTVASLVLALLSPKWYLSYATLKMSSEDSFSIGSIVGNLSNIPFLDEFGIGATQSNIERYIAILESRTTLDSMLFKFDLQRRYHKKYRFQTRKELLNNSIREADPMTDILTVGIYDTDPELAKEMVVHYVSLLDRAILRLFNEGARNNRIFAQKRLTQTTEELKAAEDTLAEFQQKYGLFEPKEQLFLSLKIASDLEAALIEEKIKLGVATTMMSKENAEVKNIELKISEIQNQINQLKQVSQNDEADWSTLIHFDKAPNLAVRYFRLFREVEIKSKILEFLVPIFEKAKIDEQKDIPSLLVIDEPQVAEYKAKPKRALIVMAGFLFSLTFSLSVVLLRNYLQNYYADASEEIRSKMDYILSQVTRKNRDNRRSAR